MEIHPGKPQLPGFFENWGGGGGGGGGSLITQLKGVDVAQSTKTKALTCSY